MEATLALMKILKKISNNCKNLTGFVLELAGFILLCGLWTLILFFTGMLLDYY